jgi:hypothetical protein
MTDQKRLLGFRKQLNQCLGDLSFPFASIGFDNCRLYDIFIRLGEDDYDSVENFPNCIEEYIWTHDGNKDNDFWHCLARLKNGNYVYYTAIWDGKWSMKLYSSQNRAFLVHFALTESAYKLYINQTTYYKDIPFFKGLVYD